MFRSALSIARNFTFPIVVSRKSVGGACGSMIGTAVIVNDEGWLLTAAHILTAVDEMAQSQAKVIAHGVAKAAIEAAGLAPKERSNQLRSLGKLGPDETEHFSIWWGRDGVAHTVAHLIPSVDLALVKLNHWDPSWCSSFPTFKDPSKDVEPGVSLCKLGFPFHSIIPTFDQTTSTFSSPSGSLPLPSFPMEGMLTREAPVPVPAGMPLPFPLKWIETSSPGLKGQSGGPIVDVHGTVWAIQANTAFLALGFDPKDPITNQAVHQFLNVGRGPHPATICGMLDSHSVKFTKSAY